MLEKYVNDGDKVEIRPIQRASLKEEQPEERIFLSKVNQILGEDKLEILMPLEQSRMVLLPRNIVLNMVIYTANGLFQCEAKATDRYKNGNVYLQVLELISGIKRYQRREFYRYNCTMPIYSRSLKDEEKENLVFDSSIPCVEGTSYDIGGGGIRFAVNQQFQPKEMILCILPLEIKGSVREVKTIAKVLSCKPIKNSEAYEARVQFEGIAHRDRELIIQYIFEDERKRRRHEAGL